MSLRIRPFNNEYDDVVALVNLRLSEPLTADQLRDRHDRFSNEGIRNRLVAEDGAGRIIGYANVARSPWDKPGKFYAMVVTAAESRNRGVGSGLLEAQERFARENGGQEVAESVRDSDEASLNFATRRGYVMERHMYESVLDLAAFDDSRFAGVVEQVRAGGIRFLTMADAPGAESEQRLYEMDSRTVEGLPGYDLPVYPPFADWRKWLLENPEVSHDRIFVAADGDRYVGMTTLEERANGAFYTGYTGIDPDYRGRRIALALKLLAVDAARQAGAPYMRTNNDSTNEPMLAVNRKLGYVPCPGFYQLIKKL